MTRSDAAPPASPSPASLAGEPCPDLAEGGGGAGTPAGAATAGPVPALDRRAILLQGIGVILVSSVLFGAMAVCVRVAVREMPASQVAFIRFAGSLLVLLLLRRGRSLRPHSGLPGVVLRGVLGASAILLYYRAIAGAGAGLATLLHCTYPLWTAVFASAFLGERFRANLIGALALFVIGIAVVLGPGTALSERALFGALSALVAAVLAGGAVTTARRLRTTETAFLVTTYFMAVGMVFTAPALASGLPPLRPDAILILVGVVLTSVGGQVLLHQGLGFAPAVQASLAAAASVVSAAVLEAVFLDERLSAYTLAGACLLIAAVALAVREPPDSLSRITRGRGRG